MNHDRLEPGLLTRSSALVNITAAFSTDPNDSCGNDTPTFNLGALNWISMSGCHLAGMKSQLVRRSNTVGLNMSKLLAQITTIRIKLEMAVGKREYQEMSRVINHCSEGISLAYVFIALISSSNESLSSALSPFDGCTALACAIWLPVVSFSRRLRIFGRYNSEMA